MAKAVAVSTWRVANLWEWIPVWSAVALFVLNIIVLQQDLQRFRISSASLQTHHQLDRYASELLQSLTDAEASVWGYALTGQPRFRRAFDQALDQLAGIRDRFSGLAREVAIDDSVCARLNQAIDLSIESLRLLRRTENPTESRDPEVGAAMNKGMARMADVRTEIRQVRLQSVSRVDGLLSQFQGSLRISLNMSIVSGLCSCLLLGIGTWRLRLSMMRSRQLVKRMARDEQDVRQLVATVQSAHEESRASMARRVHDEIGQNLTAAKIDLTLGMRKVSATEEAARGRMQSAIALIDQTLQIARDIAMELRPAILDHVGLQAAVQWQLNQFEARSGVAVRFVEGQEPTVLSRQAKVVLFRVLQEALTNVLRHSQATEVVVRIHRDSTHVTLLVEDNGRGFDPERVSGRSMGILGMRERLRSVEGFLELTNQPGNGARLVAAVPVPAIPEDEDDESSKEAE